MTPCEMNCELPAGYRVRIVMPGGGTTQPTLMCAMHLEDSRLKMSGYEGAAKVLAEKLNAQA